MSSLATLSGVHLGPGRGPRSTGLGQNRTGVHRGRGHRGRAEEPLWVSESVIGGSCQGRCLESELSESTKDKRTVTSRRQLLFKPGACQR